ncbi:MAG TPA: alpha-L-rhamnosidase C-terminal domain-containing protein [Alphaproteobacteria bacterium]|nr:alpha-L-rhamnosidase C-terminal domain-containing protein [Alphaproteobacteria bacterium]
MTYAEALYDQANRKGDRNAVDDRQVIGVEDLFLPDGKPGRVFETHWWRTWRFMEISVETNDQPVTINGVEAFETGYPFDLKASFESSDPELNRIWEIGWRTLEVDSHETFMDTAYWEQLQYVGDARVEAVIDYVTTADPRLPLQAVTAIRDSRTAAGITQSRYPSRSEQSIPTFSLLWIGMLHDYWMHVPDGKTIADSISLVRSVLDWFGQYQLPNGLLGKVPDWNFVDWIKPEDRSYPSFGTDDASCVTSLILLGALDEAADLESSLGNRPQSRADRDHAQRLQEAVRSACWDQSRGMIADTPDKKLFSQDGNALAVLYDAVPKGQARAVLLKVAPPGAAEAPEGLLPASYYFRFYLARAYERAGLGDRYLELLQPFRDLLKLHFTTWPEVRGETRSDSHAWSAHPTADLLRIVAGIEPSAPGYSSVRIEPHLGSLISLNASAPTPKGLVKVRYAARGNALVADITVPQELPATFVWRGKMISLHAGTNELQLNGGTGERN